MPGPWCASNSVLRSHAAVARTPLPRGPSGGPRRNGSGAFTLETPCPGAWNQRVGWTLPRCNWRP
eukprot:11653105-Alexandrium_andersonii.AAC.1